MKIQTVDESRKKEIISVCLQQFIEKGLYDTSVRDLSNALKMQASGLYYHFPSKDDVVLVCAEEAGLQLADVLFRPLLDCLGDVAHLTEATQERIEEMSPTMRFFSQVCTTEKYRESMKPVLNRIRQRHIAYAEKIAKQLECEEDDIAPFLYACVATTSNYMIFGESIYYTRPLELMKIAIQRIRNNSDQKGEMQK